MSLLVKLLAFGVAANAVRGPMEILNATLRGRLEIATPLDAACFARPTSSDCPLLKKGLSSAYYRANEFSGFRHLQGEACAADPADGCLLEAGTLNVTSAADVLAVFDYARQSGLPISIKNSGVDYVMRSSRRGSLAIWTRGLGEMIYHSSFQPSRCHGASTRAITLGAGVSMDEAYIFAHKHGVVFSGGTVSSIGASGGWLLNGGHGVLSGSLGLGVDRVVEITIVTPDGQIRVANKCTNSDLFWALRGGAGGAFGVVLNSTHLVETESPLTAAYITFPPTENNQRGFVSILGEKMRDWALEGWGGPSTTSLAYLINPYLNVSEAKKMLAPAVEYAKRQNGTATFQLFPSFFEFYAQVMNGTFANPPPISAAVFVTSRFIPEAVFQKKSRRDFMVEEIMKMQQAGFSPQMLTTAPLLYARNHPKPETSLYPAWYKSVWSIVATTAWTTGTNLEGRQETVISLRKITEKLSEIAPDGVTYANEADPGLENWATQYWGDNYSRLLHIKHTVDPDNLLTCWHCVGWDESLPAYECTKELYK